MKKRPVTTLFMLSSVDRKISTGNSDLLDVDSDYPAMDGVKEGLHQYSEFRACTGQARRKPKKSIRTKHRFLSLS